MLGGTFDFYIAGGELYTDLQWFWRRELFLARRGLLGSSCLFTQDSFQARLLDILSQMCIDELMRACSFLL